MANYIEYHFTISPPQPASEILIAELGAVDFESFVEDEEGVLAYISEELWHPNILDEVSILNSEAFAITFSRRAIPQQNWNAEWERNFHPIVVDDTCTVRAPFHQRPETTYDIIIEPKMSFGTGHHETTHMMIQQLLSLDLSGRRVLDMGCGTGVLAILAEKLKANPIMAIDIDEWCYLNTLENIARNNCQHVKAFQGDASLLEGKMFDVVLANINRNTLLQDMKVYAAAMTPEASLVLSGFFMTDHEDITRSCEQFGFQPMKTLQRNDWISVSFQR